MLVSVFTSALMGLFCANILTIFLRLFISIKIYITSQFLYLSTKKSLCGLVTKEPSVIKRASQHHETKLC